MKIGITERGDAALDYSWVEAITFGTVDGAILITKNMDAVFRSSVLSAYHDVCRNIIVHCTCTGLGGTIYEPNVPDYITQLTNLSTLIHWGFPIENCVIRVDPIIPTAECVEAAKRVIEFAFSLNLLPRIRIRISILDEYKHVKKRFTDAGIDPVYGEKNFQPSSEQRKLVTDMLQQFPLNYECCAESKLYGRFTHTGCISSTDLSVFGMSCSTLTTNPQNRSGCRCLSCKAELLKNRHRCEHQCLYCYWKD